MFCWISIGPTAGVYRRGFAPTERKTTIYFLLPIFDPDGVAFARVRLVVVLHHLHFLYRGYAFDPQEDFVLVEIQMRTKAGQSI